MLKPLRRLGEIINLLVMKHKFFLTILILVLVLFPVQKTFAASGLFSGIEGCLDKGDCTLCQFLTLFVNITNVITSIIGGLALVYFVYAGFGLIQSFGSAEKVKEAKDSLVGTLFGIVIVLGSWILVNTVFFYFVQDANSDGKVNIWGKAPWSDVGGMCTPVPKK